MGVTSVTRAAYVTVGNGQEKGGKKIIRALSFSVSQFLRVALSARPACLDGVYLAFSSACSFLGSLV